MYKLLFYLPSVGFLSLDVLRLISMSFDKQNLWIHEARKSGICIVKSNHKCLFLFSLCGLPVVLTFLFSPGPAFYLGFLSSIPKIHNYDSVILCENILFCSVKWQMFLVPVVFEPMVLFW